MFPGSPTLIEARDALWSVRDDWFDLGVALGLVYTTLQVIERQQFPIYNTLYMVS